MKPSILLLAVACAIGCAAAPIRTFVGQPEPWCRLLGEVRGFRGTPATRGGAATQVVAEAGRLGADALRFRAVVDEEYRALAFACGDAGIHAVRVVASKFVRADVPGSCQEVGPVESTLARNQVELREVLTASAAGMGGNVMRLDATGSRRTAEGDRVTGVGTAFWCPDLW